MPSNVFSLLPLRTAGNYTHTDLSFADVMGISRMTCDFLKTCSLGKHTLFIIQRNAANVQYFFAKLRNTVFIYPVEFPPVIS